MSKRKSFFLTFLFYFMGVVAFGFFVSPPYLFISSPSTNIGFFMFYPDWD